MEEILKYGSWMIAMVNFIGLIVVWVKDFRKSQRISDLEKINQTITDQNKLLGKSLSDIQREIGIGTEVSARNVLAKKYEIDELRNQLAELKNQTKALEQSNSLIVKQQNYQSEQDKSNLQIQKGAYIIQEQNGIAEYHYDLHLENYGNRNALNLSYKVYSVLLEDDTLNEIDKLDESSNNPISGNGGAFTIKMLTKTNILKKDLLVVCNYKYTDSYSESSIKSSSYFKLRNGEIGKQKNLWNVSSEEKRILMEKYETD